MNMKEWNGGGGGGGGRLSHLLGALDTEADVTVVVTHNHERLKKLTSCR